ENAEAVREVRGQLQGIDVLVEFERAADVRADLRVRVEHQEPGMLVRQAELARRAEHSVARHAAHLYRFDGEAARKPGTGQGAGHLEARRDVRGAADDLAQASFTGIDLADP